MVKEQANIMEEKFHPLHDTIPTSVAVDLDGTLLTYDYWRGEEHFGEPLSYAHEALKLFKENGWHVIVWTSRNDTKKIRSVVDKYFPGCVDEINIHAAFEDRYGKARKLVADLYIDDRAWPHCGNPVDWTVVLANLRARGILNIPESIGINATLNEIDKILAKDDGV